MLKFSSVMIGTEDSARLADFYRKVLGEELSQEEGGWYNFDLGGAILAIGPHDQVHGKSKSPERIIINFESIDVKGEFERIKALGAEVKAEPYSMGDNKFWIATFTDPDGNYFQLMSPWES